MKITISLTVALIALAAASARAETSENVRVVVPSHDIARGEVIGAADLIYGAVPATTSVGDLITTVKDIEGREARRLLRAGETVRTSDVRWPILITKGATVTMTFDAPGVTLTAMGRAVSEGGLGESVTVLNPVSYRQITATVTGPGQVRAGDSGAVVASDQK
ncbi:MAG: flagellar basal body P-ring formation chaperone FlgA [Rhizomicrobium sp.]|jgi:flagella basal body P-ring formation protein FlgA